MWRLEQVVIFPMDCSDHPCCLHLLGLLFSLVLGLALVFALVPTANSFLLCRKWQCLVLERRDFSLALNIENDLGSARVDNGSNSV